VASVINQSRGKVTIEVHTDNIGTSADNVKLALERAKAVRDGLVEAVWPVLGRGKLRCLWAISPPTF